MNGEILYQGHGSLRITSKSGFVIYVDPFAGAGYDLPADLILVTHQHHDHNCIEKPVRRPGCVIIQNTDALVRGEYKSFNVGEVNIEAVEAYNSHHPKDECVGYIITLDSVKIYAAGDTSETSRMRKMSAENIDYAFLPADGIYNMDVKKAAECARLISPRFAIPYHMIPGGLFSSKIADKFTPSNRLIVKNGETIQY